MSPLCLAQKIIPSAFVAGTDGRDLLLTCVLPPRHGGDHRCGHYRWAAERDAEREGGAGA